MYHHFHHKHKKQRIYLSLRDSVGGNENHSFMLQMPIVHSELVVYSTNMPVIHTKCKCLSLGGHYQCYICFFNCFKNTATERFWPFCFQYKQRPKWEPKSPLTVGFLLVKSDYKINPFQKPTGIQRSISINEQLQF